MTTRFRTTLLVALVCGAVVAAAGTDAPHAREALGQLKAGNDRFARNASLPVSLSNNRRDELAKGEHPIATVLSCADSRVPPEHVFNVGLGDLFVIRTAGQVIDQSILASIEFSAEHLHVPLLVVMGHESCSAVQAAAGDADKSLGPNRAYLVKAIQAARLHTPKESDDIRDLVLANVEQVINDVMVGSQLVRRAVEKGSLQIVGAYYELANGRVTFSEPIGKDAKAAKTGSH